MATDPARYLVTFLPERPRRTASTPCRRPRAAASTWSAGRELYLWLPDGIANTPLAAWKWDRLLGVAGTGRNWNTVTQAGRADRVTGPRPRRG